MADTPTQFFFDAVEIVVAKRELTAKKAAAFIKTNLASGKLTLVNEDGTPVTAIQFEQQLAKID